MYIILEFRCRTTLRSRSSYLLPFQNHYYAQWFAFPDHHLLGELEPVLWQNVWTDDGDPADAEPLISEQVCLKLT